ncbi:MAG TPA: chromosomal replication initiator protein DnaA, partial [Peptococcaceae bacterium]|nr:chromosomal replication initiator protein DnaA [Peptococcaceae bacterium]
MLAAELHAAWEQVLQRLQKKINTQSFDHWIKPLKPVTIYGNTVFIEVPNHFSRDWLLDRYAGIFKQAFERTLGHDVAVQFLLTAEVPQVLHALTRLKTRPQERFTYLNPKYTFDTFVVGNSNRFAHAAALAVAE